MLASLDHRWTGSDLKGPCSHRRLYRLPPQEANIIERWVGDAPSSGDWNVAVASLFPNLDLGCNKVLDLRYVTVLSKHILVGVVLDLHLRLLSRACDWRDVGRKLLLFLDDITQDIEEIIGGVGRTTGVLGDGRVWVTSTFCGGRSSS